MSILRDIIYGAVSYGADLHRVCAALDLDPQDLNDSERLVPFKPAAEVWDVVLAETNNHFLGLQLGEKISPSILGLIGYLMQSSRTLLEAIMVFAKFNDLHSTMLKYKFEESDDHLVIHYEPALVWKHQYPESVRQSIELAMSGMITIFKTLSGRNIFPVRVELPYSKRNVHEYERIFRGAIKFNANRSALTFTKRDLEAPISSYDTSLFARFENILKDKVKLLRIEKKFSDLISQTILTDFKGNAPSVEVMASQLNMTPRAIQRKLKEESTTYRQITGRFKKELAEVILVNKEFRVSEVASLLGYSDSSAFRKALKRWNQE
ncbi:MAG TPA: AraC family transcriptional regulator ligand-binding domain-containing protein [Cyclobacteriaceae bacterium]